MPTLAVMMIAIILPAAGLAWEKEAGTIEQLLVMPFRRRELMLAEVIPTFVVSLGALALAFWVPWWFAVPIRGSVLLFFTLFPLLVISGMVVPVDSMPRPVQSLAGADRVEDRAGLCAPRPGSDLHGVERAQPGEAREVTVGRAQGGAVLDRQGGQGGVGDERSRDLGAVEQVLENIPVTLAGLDRRDRR
jgi:hypothetical protein